MHKKICSALYHSIIFLLCLFMSGCSLGHFASTSESSMPSEDSTNEIADISLFCDIGFWVPPVWDQTPGTITGDISAITGVSLDVMEITQNADTQLKILLLNDKLPDIISVTDTVTINQLVTSGKVWKLDEFFQLYKPDSHLLSYVPEDVMTELIKRDGAWYAFPSHINSPLAQERWIPTDRYQTVNRYGSNFAIIWNKELLEYAGLNIEDLQTEQAVLDAFEKVKNLTYNGKQITPLIIDGNTWQNSTLTFLQNSFGAEWIGNDGAYMDILLQPQSKHALAFLNTAARKGYLDPKQINMTVNDLQEALDSNPYLCFIGNINNTAVMIDEWISSGVILSQDGSKPVFGVNERATTGWISTFISKSCSQPELIANFLDYMVSEEGMRFWNMGYEGIDYCVEDNGLFRYITSPEEIENKKLQIWWMFVNSAWQRSNIYDESELAFWDDDAHTAYGRNEHTMVYDASLYVMPEGLISSDSAEGKLEREISEWKTTQLTSILLSTTEQEFESQYNLLINGLKAKGIDTIDQIKNNGYQSNCQEYQIQNHKINKTEETK